MSFYLPFSKVTDEIKKEILEKCNIKPSSTQFEPDPKPINCFIVDTAKKRLIVPMGLWNNYYDKFPNTEKTKDRQFKFRKNLELYTKKTDPKGSRDQKTVVREALKKLKKSRTVFLAVHTGFGKTVTGIYLSSKLPGKVLVLCHINDLHKQWKAAYEKFTTAKTSYIKKKLDPNANVYFIGILKAYNRLLEDPTYFNDISTVIIDESHIVTQKCFSEVLLRIRPQYLIGLSATPKRSDGLQKMFIPYFGPVKSYIKRHEVKEMRVIKYETDFKPEISLIYVKGRMMPSWTKIITSIAINRKRNKTIAKIARKFSNNNILILTGRDDQVEMIEHYCKKYKIDCGTYYQKTKRGYNPNKRVIIAGVRKGGTGLDDPTRDMLIQATDVKNINQYEGRIRQNNCTILYMVDGYRTFEKHWEGHETWLISRGAKNIEYWYNGEPYEPDDVGEEEERVRFLK